MGQVTEIDGKLINEGEFNEKAQAWAIKLKRNFKSNIKSGAKNSRGILEKSITSSLSKRQGVLNRISFGFYRYGVFVAYGVGRGYIHTSAGVVRGRRTEQYHKKHRQDKSMFVAYGSGAVKREPIDFFNSELDKNIDELADLITEYYGDKYILADNALARLKIQ